MARTLSLTEQAAQKRVNRAVDRRRENLLKRGIPATTGGLAALISSHAVQSAPAGLAASISVATSLAGAAIPSAALETATHAILMTTTQKILVAAPLAAALGTGIYQTHRSSNLTAEVEFNPTAREMQLWVDRVDRLKAWLEVRPQDAIPELQFITERFCRGNVENAV